jgi:uncharacterized membrane protein
VHAVRWNPDGSVVDLGTPDGGYSSYAQDINDKGVAVGFTQTMDGDRALHWSAYGAITDLDAGPASARGINIKGTIIGVGGSGSGANRGLRWALA